MTPLHTSLPGLDRHRLNSTAAAAVFKCLSVPSSARIAFVTGQRDQDPDSGWPPTTGRNAGGHSLQLANTCLPATSQATASGGQK